MQFRIVAAVACVVALSGCATIEDVVPVPYTAQGGTQSGAGIKVTAAVVDGRTLDRARISTKINGFGQELAAIRSDRDVTAIVKDAFEAELRSRGYSLAPGGPSVTISVKRFYSKFKQGVFSGEADADVQLSATVALPDGTKRYERDIAVTGVESGVQLASGSNAAASLSDGMKKAFATIFADESFLAALRGQGAPVAARNVLSAGNS